MYNQAYLINLITGKRSIPMANIFRIYTNYLHTTLKISLLIYLGFFSNMSVKAQAWSEYLCFTSSSTPHWWEQIDIGDQIWSANGMYMLTMQTDGNLVFYGPNGPIWDSGTQGGSSSRFVVMGESGDLTMYDFNAGGRIWSLGEDSRPHYGTCLKVQDDGKLVIYDSNFGVPLSQNCGKSGWCKI
jgi:hypothetical protein